jgi:hypothetical protein
VHETAVQDAHPAFGQRSQGLVVGVAPGPVLVVVPAGPAEVESEQKAHRSRALARRRFRANRARATLDRPEAWFTWRCKHLFDA